MGTQHEIRLATEADFATICDLVFELKLVSERWRITNTMDNSTYWVATETVGDGEGRIVACVGLEHGAKASLLRSAAVLPDSQGHGIGRELANTAIAHSQTRGDDALYLFSTGAGDYWQRFGFVPISVWTLAEALPTTPQVRSGIERGWIADDAAFVLNFPKS